MKEAGSSRSRVHDNQASTVCLGHIASRRQKTDRKAFLRWPGTSQPAAAGNAASQRYIWIAMCMDADQSAAHSGHDTSAHIADTVNM